MTKMGLKPVTGINRVTIKKGKAFVISIDDPDVWKTPGNENSYIIFGKPNMDGLQTGQNEINQFKNPVTPEGTEEAKVEAPSAETAAKVETTAEDLNEEGLTPDNIKMVVEYTKCTRAEAIRVLRETGDDSVNAIMKLTK
jgi:nascent polypeptide-associated complex subunit alpha